MLGRTVALVLCLHAAPVAAQEVPLAELFGSDRATVGHGRVVVEARGRWVEYEDGLTAWFEDGRMVRARVRGCRPSHLEDLAALGFDVSAARTEWHVDAEIVFGVPGFAIEGRGRVCRIRVR